MPVRLTTLTAVVLAGCGASAGAPGVTVTDSAGVTVVTNGPSTLAAAQPWTLTQSLEIRSSDASGVTLYDVRQIAVLDGGAIAVINGDQNEVLVFARDGSLLHRLGRAGDGPGEFKGPASLVTLPGDSLGVYDSRHKRLSVFGSGGVLAREVSLAPVPEGSSYEYLFALPDGDLVLFTQGGIGHVQQQGASRVETESLVLAADGARRGTLGPFPGGEVFVGEYGGRRLAGPVLFGALTWAAPFGGGLAVGTAEAPEVRVYDPRGALDRVVRWPDRERAVTEARVDDFISAAEAAAPPEEAGGARQVFSSIPRSEEEPAYEGLLASPGGDLWVGSYRGPEVAVLGAPSPAGTWRVFDPDGQLTASVATPEGFEPLSVTKDEVLGVFVDDLGVESVRGYRIVKGPQS